MGTIKTDGDTRLAREFFERDVVTVARDLPGCFLIRQTEKGKIVGKIIETEAYGDTTDLASHARFGEKGRSKLMFGPAGMLYVYSIYGIFELSNIICGKVGHPSAVLLRAAEVVQETEVAKANLSRSKFVKINDKLATGPGKLSLAFGIAREFNGVNITNSELLYILDKRSLDSSKLTRGDKGRESFDIIETTRIGINYAKESKDLPWRFYIKDNPYVSKK